VAAARTSEPLEIAEALVKLRRQTLAAQIVPEPIATHAIASSFVSDSTLIFQRRVDRLLALLDVPASACGGNQSNFSTIGAVVFAVSIVTMSALLVFAPLSVHHGAEALIAIFK